MLHIEEVLIIVISIIAISVLAINVKNYENRKVIKQHLSEYGIRIH